MYFTLLDGKRIRKKKASKVELSHKQSYMSQKFIMNNDQ